MNKKKKKKIFKSKVRIFITFIIFGLLFSMLGYDCLSNIKKINELKKEKILLNSKIFDLQSEKEILESDIQRLNDPDYIAKYVREKYYYSKDGELILKMDK